MVEIQRRREERSRIKNQIQEQRRARAAQEEAVAADAGEAARVGKIAQAPEEVQPQPGRPEIIFAGRRMLPPPRRLEDEDMPEVEELSSDSSFDRMLDGLENERQRASVSNPDDAPKPEDSEESVAQNRAGDEEVQQQVHDESKEGEKLEAMDVKFGECEGERNTSTEMEKGCDKEGGCSENRAHVNQKIDEVDDLMQGSNDREDRGEEVNDGEEEATCDDQKAPGSTEATEEPQEEMEEKRFQEERKRKGKEKVVPPPKKKRVSRPASRTVTIREPSPAAMEISDSDESSDSDSSFYVEEGENAQDSDTSLVDSDEERDLISYEVMEVEVEQEDAEE